LHCPAEPVSAHDLHEPLHAVEQQTPCAQIPDAHCAPIEQEAPFGTLPQELPRQLLPAAQFASVVHAVKQRPPLQT
jgi:hypothetical protein